MATRRSGPPPPSATASAPCSDPNCRHCASSIPSSLRAQILALEPQFAADRAVRNEIRRILSGGDDDTSTPNTSSSNTQSSSASDSESSPPPARVRRVGATETDARLLAMLDSIPASTLFETGLTCGPGAPLACYSRRDPRLLVRIERILKNRVDRNEKEPERGHDHCGLALAKPSSAAVRAGLPLRLFVKWFRRRCPEGCRWSSEGGTASERKRAKRRHDTRHELAMYARLRRTILDAPGQQPASSPWHLMPWFSDEFWFWDEPVLVVERLERLNPDEDDEHEVGAAVVRCLRFLHQFAVHSDLKPHNIMRRLAGPGARPVYLLIDLGGASSERLDNGYRRRTWTEKFTSQAFKGRVLRDGAGRVLTHHDGSRRHEKQATYPKTDLRELAFTLRWIEEERARRVELRRHHRHRHHAAEPAAEDYPEDWKTGARFQHGFTGRLATYIEYVNRLPESHRLLDSDYDRMVEILLGAAAVSSSGGARRGPPAGAGPTLGLANATSTSRQYR